MYLYIYRYKDQGEVFFCYKISPYLMYNVLLEDQGLPEEVFLKKKKKKKINWILHL